MFEISVILRDQSNQYVGKPVKTLAAALKVARDFSKHPANTVHIQIWNGETGKLEHCTRRDGDKWTDEGVKF